MQIPVYNNLSPTSFIIQEQVSKTCQVCMGGSKKSSGVESLYQNAVKASTFKKLVSLKCMCLCGASLYDKVSSCASNQRSVQI